MLVDYDDVLSITKNNVPETQLSRVEFKAAEKFPAGVCGNFQLILALNVLHELSGSAQAQVIQDLSTLLANEGTLVVQTACRDLAPEWYAEGLRIATLTRARCKSDVLTLNQYELLLEEAGLTVSENLGPTSVMRPGQATILARKKGAGNAPEDNAVAGHRIRC